MSLFDDYFNKFMGEFFDDFDDKKEPNIVRHFKDSEGNTYIEKIFYNENSTITTREFLRESNITNSEKIKELEFLLEKNVSEENYEKAAEIRDELNKLKLNKDE
jgi:protein-arginine kinase activator protein McsA